MADLCLSHRGRRIKGGEGLAGTGVSRQARGALGRLGRGGCLGQARVTWQVGAEGRRADWSRARGWLGETSARKLPHAANSIS